MDQRCLAEMFDFSEIAHGQTPVLEPSLSRKQSKPSIMKGHQTIFIVLRLKNNERCCNVCREHTPTSNHTFGKDVFRRALL